MFRVKFLSFFISLLVTRSILLLLGHTFSESAQPEIFCTAPLFFAAAALANIIVYRQLSKRLSEEKYDALFSAPHSNRSRSFTVDMVVVALGWTITLAIIFMNPPG